MLKHKLTTPQVGYGTWASGDTNWAKDATLTALKSGYRHLDCAWMYGVDAAVGQAIKESGIPREEIFVTSKFWPHFAADPKNVDLCLDQLLAGMGLEYVDLWLAHWPTAFEAIDQGHLEKARAGPDTTNEDRGMVFDKDEKPVIEYRHTSSTIAKAQGKEGSFVPVWKAMQECVRKGKARAVGVSNFSIAEMEELLEHQGDAPISCNQVEGKWKRNTGTDRTEFGRLTLASSLPMAPPERPPRVVCQARHRTDLQLAFRRPEGGRCHAAQG